MILHSKHSTVPLQRLRAVEQSDVSRFEVVQYGDFGCLNCGKAATTLKTFQERFEQQIRFSYKHFPRNAFQPRALLAAEAAECARAQGLFWRMHDVLMANQDLLELQCIYDYADQAGLNMARFDRDMDGEVYLPKVREHVAEAIAMGVVRTPAFVVDGSLIEWPGGLRVLYEATEARISFVREMAQQ
jgi:protein-disulfide isomerase